MNASPASALEAVSRGLALCLEERPPLLVRVTDAAALVEDAHELVTRLEAEVASGARSSAVPAQVGRQRLAGWRSALARAQEAHAQATPRDHALARSLTQARLILHRYARHFGGQHRATRDLGRLVEARQHLVAVLRQVRPLAAQTSLDGLRDEARALPRFVEFLVQEQGEISDGLGGSSRLDQARALGAIAATVEAGWLQEVVPVHRLARRPGLLDRQVQSAHEVLDRMRAVRHANLPQAHEDAIVTVAGWVEAWEAERLETLAAQAAAGPEGCWRAVQAQAQAALEVVAAEVREGVGEAEAADTLRARCDRLDELLTQRLALQETAGSTATVGREEGAPDGLTTGLIDALTWLGRRYDARVAPA